MHRVAITDIYNNVTEHDRRGGYGGGAVVKGGMAKSNGNSSRLTETNLHNEGHT